MYDSTDSILRPSCGLKSRLELEIAGVGGDYQFISTAYQNCYYLPFGDRGVFKFRGDLRFVQPIASTHYVDLPVDERIFMGGENELRGFRPYRVGPKFQKKDKKGKDPKDAKKTKEDGSQGLKDSDDPSGGISLQLLSLEYQLRILPILDMFTFVDSGALSEETWDFSDLYTSVGAGVRLQIMGGGNPPLTVGMGFPLNAKSDTDVKKFFITVGGRF